MAIYNNGYPTNYYPMQYNTQPTLQNVGNVGTQNNNSIIWVQGEAGAKSYLVAPNNTVQLWDSESQTIYLKSADASGMPSMKILDYTIRAAETPHNPAQAPINDNYVTLDKFNEIRGKLSHLEAELNALKEGVSHESE